ncbi:MAG: hypothetical protein V4437_03280 [Patescibacteria group bacterium]
MGNDHEKGNRPGGSAEKEVAGELRFGKSPVIDWAERFNRAMQHRVDEEDDDEGPLF